MAACDADVVVEFSAKAFGIRFQPDRGALTVDGIAHGSAAAQADDLMVGMVLVSVQGKQVTEVGVGEVFDTLKAAGRPLQLGFSKETRPFPYVSRALRLLSVVCRPELALALDGTANPRIVWNSTGMMVELHSLSTAAVNGQVGECKERCLCALF